MANVLLDSFSIFGVPVILQSDNGREFRNQIVYALKAKLPDMNFVHGRARHPQSQGSVERSNADIKKMIASWMRENKSTKWSIECKLVQLQKNHARHSANKCSPYKSLFGIETPLGLTNIKLPVDIWSKLKTVKELYEIFGVDYDEDLLIDEDSEENVEDDQFNPKNYDGITDLGLPEVEGPEPTLDQACNTLLGIRASVRIEQNQQAEKMLKMSKKYMPEVFIGDFVCLPVPTVAGVADAPNIICRVIDIDYKHDLYELVCSAGVLNIMYARNSFEKVDSKMDYEVKCDVNTSLRGALAAMSIHVGQGMELCSCRTSCLTRRCSCKKNGMLCNSRWACISLHYIKVSK